MKFIFSSDCRAGIAAILGVGSFALSAIASGNYTNVVLADTPVAYWRLGETTGTTAFDSTVNANNGTYTNGVTRGVVGALAWDSNLAIQSAGLPNGKPSVVVPDSVSLDVSSGLTIEAWLQADSLSTYRSPIMKSSASWADGYGFVYNGGELRFFSKNYTAFAGDANAFVTGPTFQHVVGTYDGATLKIFVNGVLAGSAAYAGGVGVNSQNLLIGVAADGAEPVWNGKIDEVAIYGYALTDTQIQSHYLAGIPEPASAVLVALSGTILLWRRRR